MPGVKCRGDFTDDDRLLAADFEINPSQKMTPILKDLSSYFLMNYCNMIYIHNMQCNLKG